MMNTIILPLVNTMEIILIIHRNVYSILVRHFLKQPKYYMEERLIKWHHLMLYTTFAFHKCQLSA